MDDEDDDRTNCMVAKKKLRTPTATRFPIATVKCPKTMQRLWQPNVAVEKK
jgi:hypothetical protein